MKKKNYPLKQLLSVKMKNNIKMQIKFRELKFAESLLNMLQHKVPYVAVCNQQKIPHKFSICSK